MSVIKEKIREVLNDCNRVFEEVGEVIDELKKEGQIPDYMEEALAGIVATTNMAVLVRKIGVEIGKELGIPEEVINQGNILKMDQ